MVKSILVDDDIHKLLFDKQTALLKNNVKASLSAIAGAAIKYGIERVTENNINNVVVEDKNSEVNTT